MKVTKQGHVIANSFNEVNIEFVNTIAYEGMTYKEIFEDNNLSSISNLEHTTQGTSITNIKDGLTLSQNKIYVSTKYKSLDSDGNRSIFFRTLINGTLTSDFIVNLMIPTQTSYIENSYMFEPTENYDQIALRDTGSSPESTYQIDYIIAIDLSIFTTEPTKEQLDNLLQEYLENINEVVNIEYTNKSINSIAYEGMTYKEIFEDNNLIVDHNFEDINYWNSKC